VTSLRVSVVRLLLTFHIVIVLSVLYIVFSCVCQLLISGHHDDDDDESHGVNDSERLGCNVPINTLYVIKETSLSSQSLVGLLVLPT